MLTQERLKELLTYEPATGVFRWRERRGNQGGGCVAPGDEAGSVYKNGYRMIGVGGRRYGAHRLAFLYMTGAFPPAEVDHINGVPADNRWCWVLHL